MGMAESTLFLTGVEERRASWTWRAKVEQYVFSMRSMASGAAFRRTYPYATQQAFLEAHEFGVRLLRGRLSRASLR
jgi:hypothetical protein